MFASLYPSKKYYFLLNPLRNLRSNAYKIVFFDFVSVSINVKYIVIKQDQE